MIKRILKKRGLMGLIVGIFVFLLVVAVGAGIYFYNYHVFKEVRLCVGEGRNTMVPCESRENCLETFNITNDPIAEAPVFIRESFYSVLENVVTCEGACFIGNVRGINMETGELEMLNNCETGEKEFVMEIRGKEGVEILRWMKTLA